MKELLESSIESQIVILLKEGSLPATSLIKKIQVIRTGTPKQSVYLALRKLKKKEVVAQSGKIISLHQSWIVKMSRFFEGVSKKAAKIKESGFPNLQEKEYVTYHFNSLESLDRFWAHAFMTFMKNLASKASVLLYNPHQWFLIGRKESELNIIEEAKKIEISWVQIIGAKTFLDIEAKKNFDGVHTRCQLLDKPMFPNNYYVNCLGDFLIEVWIDEGAADEIEYIYKTHKTIDNIVQTKLSNILQNKSYKHKMKISKNKTKALKIKNVFKKYFILT